jgi:hypothetical protein
METITKREPLYQVWAEETATGQLVPAPMFPRVAKEVADEFASTMAMMIACGKEKRYNQPQVLLHIST